VQTVNSVGNAGAAASQTYCSSHVPGLGEHAGETPHKTSLCKPKFQRQIQELGEEGEEGGGADCEMKKGVN
jgi:hypothetical protein